MNSFFLPVNLKGCACHVMFFASVPVLSISQLCHWAVQSWKKDWVSAKCPEPVLTTDCSFKVSRDSQLPAIVTHLWPCPNSWVHPQSLELWPRQSGTVLQASRGDLHTKGTCYWDHSAALWFCYPKVPGSFGGKTMAKWWILSQMSWLPLSCSSDREMLWQTP